jgi:hypothetical protein
MKVHLAYENIDAELELVPIAHPEKRYRVTVEGEPATYQRYMKFDHTRRDEVLLEKEDIAKQLKDSDLDVDLELAGKKLSHTSRITIDEERYEPVYNYTLIDVLQLPDGSKRERPHFYTQGNIDTLLPIRITDELVSPKELLLSFIFRKSYQIVHNNGVTFRFLFELAEKLHNQKKFAKIETYNPDTKKREPLILYDGGRKFPAAYLEGRVKGESYCLLLHLSDQELKAPRPEEEEEQGEEE